MFLSFWLAFWSLGVGVISSLAVSKGGLIWVFVFSHGGAEIGVSWLLAKSFVAAMERSLRPPALKRDLGGITGEWGTGPRSAFVLTCFMAVGALMAVLLLGGTWGPVAIAEELSIRAVGIATFLTTAWSLIAWRWARALRQMRSMMGSVSMSATMERVEVVHARGVLEHTHEFPAAGLKAEADEGFLVLTRGEKTARIPCVESTERDNLIEMINEMSARAAAPGERSEIPAALAAMRGVSDPAGS